MTEEFKMDRETAAATARMIEGLWDLQTVLKESGNDALESAGGVLELILQRGEIESISNILYDITCEALDEKRTAAEYKWVHGSPFGELKES